jgi:hypothetical protein
MRVKYHVRAHPRTRNILIGLPSAPVRPNGSSQRRMHGGIASVGALCLTWSLGFTEMRPYVILAVFIETEGAQKSPSMPADRAACLRAHNRRMPFTLGSSPATSGRQVFPFVTSSCQRSSVAYRCLVSRNPTSLASTVEANKVRLHQLELPAVVSSRESVITGFGKQHLAPRAPSR